MRGERTVQNSQNRTIRSLDHLQNSGSTARVLNLRDVTLRMAGDPDFMTRPLFKNPDLNRAIIVKHRLRSNETEEFSCRGRRRPRSCCRSTSTT